MPVRKAVITKRASYSSLSRREVLRLTSALGGTVALATVLEACSKAGINPESLGSPTGALGLPTTAQRAASATAPAADDAAPAKTEAVPSFTPGPTEIQNDGKARVAFVKTNNQAEGVRKAIDLLGINPFDGKRVFLKPNFNSADPTPGSTHPDVLTALVTALKRMGAQQITVGDRSGMGDTRQVMEQLGCLIKQDRPA